MKNLRQYMNRASMGARILVLTGLAAIAGCNEELTRQVSTDLFMTGARQAVASGVRKGMGDTDGATVYVNGNENSNGNTEMSEADKARATDYWRRVGEQEKAENEAANDYWRRVGEQEAAQKQP